MKLLGLLRHAKSGWDDSALADFDRPLNDRGHKSARRMGEEMRSLGVGYDLAMVSPARRTVETWNIIESEWRSGLLPEQEKRLYGASEQLIADIISETNEGVGRLLVIGHNPGLHHLAFNLARGDSSPQHDQLAAKLPTGALAEIKLSIASWAGFSGSRGHIARFLRPRDLE